MVKCIFNLLLNYIFQQLHIHYKTGFRVYLTIYANNQFVVVPMKMGVVAFSENCIVLFIAPIFSIQTMGGVEMGLSTDFYFHCYRDFNLGIFSKYDRKIFQR